MDDCDWGDPWDIWIDDYNDSGGDDGYISNPQDLEWQRSYYINAFATHTREQILDDAHRRNEEAFQAFQRKHPDRFQAIESDVVQMYDRMSDNGGSHRELCLQKSLRDRVLREIKKSQTKLLRPGRLREEKDHIRYLVRVLSQGG